MVIKLRGKRAVKFLGMIFTIISLLPICLPVAFSMAFFMKTGRFVYDILMPAELFYFTLIGGIGMAILVLLKKNSPKRLIIFTTLSIANVLTSQIYATLSGLSHGSAKPVGIHLVALSIFVVLYHLLAFLVAVECLMDLKKISE